MAFQKLDLFNTLLMLQTQHSRALGHYEIAYVENICLGTEATWCWSQKRPSCCTSRATIC